MEGFPAGELRTTATAAIAADGNLLVAGHSLDVEMQQIARTRMFIAHHRRGGMQITPTIEMSPPQNAGHGGGAEGGGLGNLISRTMLPAGVDHLGYQVGGSRARSASRARRAVQQTSAPLALETAHPFGGGFGSHAKDGSGMVAAHATAHDFYQGLSTTEGESGILVDVHSVFPRKLDCSSQSASMVPIQWTNS